jgi:hypothetical protein
VNRGRLITTLERVDTPMVVIAPPLGEIERHGGISRREDDGIRWV